MAYLQGFGPEGDFLRGRFNTLWIDGSPSAARTPVAWGNSNFTPTDAAWVRFNVDHFPVAEIASVGAPGANLRRIDGTVIIEIFVPINIGEGALDDYADLAAIVFRDVTSQQGLRFGEPSMVNVGPRDGWYKKDVLVPFVRDTVFT